MLAIGTKAPNFKLISTSNQEVSLDDLKGKTTILIFYPADWSPVCGDELALINQSLKLLQKYDAYPLAISVDSKWCHSAFSEARNFHFPLLADFEPKGAISKLYEVYNAEAGCSERAFYIIDKTGNIYWNYLSPMAENPGVDGILNALDTLDS